MDIEDFCLLVRFLHQLGGTPAATEDGPVRMSSLAEVRAFFGLSNGGTKIVVNGGPGG